MASLHPLFYDYQSTPFFLEWFYSIFNPAIKRKEHTKNYLFSFEEGLKAFEKAGLIQIESQHIFSPMLFHDPIKVVKHLVLGVGFYQEELAELPWKARQDVLSSLFEQGRRICQKYSEESSCPCYTVYARQ